MNTEKLFDLLTEFDQKTGQKQADTAVEIFTMTAAGGVTDPRAAIEYVKAVKKLENSEYWQTLYRLTNVGISALRALSMIFAHAKGQYPELEEELKDLEAEGQEKEAEAAYEAEFQALLEQEEADVVAA